MKGDQSVKEQDIVDLLKAHNEKGIEELLKHYGPLIRYIVSPILSNEQDREDCISEITMRIWEKIELYNSESGTWKAWITTIARNLALNHARKKKYSESLDDMSDNMAAYEPTPEELVLKKERQRIITEAVNALPIKDKLLFYRKYYYMQPMAQIASELGMTERAVEGKLYRIKKQLRKRLGGVLYE